jgi:flagellar basal-body rod modification protein FlgD
MSSVGLDNILATQKAQEAASTSSATDKVTSQKDMFLNLLVKQLQYQDPLNPVENTEFASQLAQFSQLEQLSTMSSNIEEMTKYQNSMNSMQAVSFVGKTVSASGNTINYSSGSSEIDFGLDSNAATVAVKIYNSSGTVVRTISMSNIQKGNVQCTWDGRDGNGETVSPGTYYFSISAKDYNGAAVDSTTYTNGTVTGIKYINGTVYLEVGDKRITMSQVQSISN